MTRRQSILIISLITIYIITFTIFTIERYERYNATGWDLGIFTQLTWNAAHGRFLQNTIAEYDNMLAIHAPYITILLAPLMWIWADPRMMLIAQTVLLAIGAWPLARLASRYFPEKWVPPVFAALWLLYPPLEWTNRWDFHEIAPAAAFLVFAVEAMDRRAWRQVDIWLILTILCKEEAGLNVAFAAIFMAWRFKRNRRICAVWFVVGMAWFIVHAFIIFPTLRGAENGLPLHAARYNWILDGNLQTMWDYLTGPHLSLKLSYLFKLFWPLGFLVLADPRAMIIALPTFALNLLSSYHGMFSLHYHYNVPIIAALQLSTLFGIVQIRRRFQWRLPVIMAPLLAVTLLSWIIYNPLFGTLNQKEVFGWESGAHIEALNAAKTLIPPDACVVAENNIQPHYSVRRETYVIDARGTGPVGDADGCAYMIVDLGDPRHDDFAVGEAVACYQFWSQKRTPIYFRDTVVVLQWMSQEGETPAEADPQAWEQMNAYCQDYAANPTPSPNQG